jgi:hypothetical protein
LAVLNQKQKIMKKLSLLVLVILATSLLISCQKEDPLNDETEDAILKKAMVSDAVPGSSFVVTIENISTVYDFFEAGAQFVPDGEDEPGPAFPGHSFTIQFHAGKGHKLSFASMYGASNDLFYAPADEGISLFNGDEALTGNITELISLWDAGTEVNHAPGSGEDGMEEAQPIRSVRNTDNVMDGFDYNDVEENIEVWLVYDGTSMFTLKINVLETSATPLSPVAWVVHSDMQHPVFTEGELDNGNGLEALAETGNAGPLSEYLSARSGYVSPVAPGVWVLHKKGQMPIFREGKPDYGEGLELLSETGDPTLVYQSLTEKDYETGLYNTPEGNDGPGPLFPGAYYSFTFTAHVGECLSFASMLGKSNDLFFAPASKGIQLFHGNLPVEGDITDQLFLWDAGTEVNEYPGAGIHQGPGGIDESENVDYPDDDFVWPMVDQVIKVTITPI